LHQDVVPGDCSDAFRVKFVFGGMDALMQRLRAVIVEDWHGLLADDRSGITPASTKCTVQPVTFTP